MILLLYILIIKKYKYANKQILQKLHYAYNNNKLHFIQKNIFSWINKILR